MENKKWSWFAFGVVVGLLIGLGIAGTYGWMQAERAREAEMRAREEAERTRKKLEDSRNRLEESLQRSLTRGLKVGVPLTDDDRALLESLAKPGTDAPKEKDH
jgi:hypothetical protein